MTIRKLSLFVFFILFILASSCGKNDYVEEPEPTPEPKPEPENPLASAYIQRVNSFVYQMMTEAYLWYDQMPDIDWRYQKDSKKYFRKLLTAEDKFSGITDDALSLINSLEGVEKTFGYSLTFSWMDVAETEIAAIVEYVYPNSPAATAGIVGGDLILSIDNQKITQGNMYDLIDKEMIKIERSKYTQEGTAISDTITLTAATITQNPVHTSKILEVGGQKIGYLFYTNYIHTFNPALDKVFSDFKAAGVSELILDLRYNSGGDQLAIINLCSHIAPVQVINDKSLIVKNEYNDIQEKHCQDRHIDNSYYFTDTLTDDNLNLKRIFILTSKQTYSASEVTIVGLQPYMDVVCIGEKTGGKYTGIQVLQPIILMDGKEFLDPIIGNWAIFPIVSQYKNKDGKNPKGGLVPDHEVNSFYLPMVELGDEKDPLISKAIELISGKPAVVARSVSKTFEYNPFSYKSSRFDDVKGNIIIK